MASLRLAVVGDAMLDQFIWGSVVRISPEAPVPIIDFERENLMPGGAANVARNLTSFGAAALLHGAAGDDPEARRLEQLLETEGVAPGGLLRIPGRHTTTKTRLVAGQQQIARLDRESRAPIPRTVTEQLLANIVGDLRRTDAILVADYAKGVVGQTLLDGLKTAARENGVWLSLDPKPAHALDLRGLSLITPNRRETFDLAGIPDSTRNANPLADEALLRAAGDLLDRLQPAVLLVTLGELGLLLCLRGRRPVHVPTVAREVYDVSGAGDTVIAVFTLGIAAGASAMEAAILANHAAGVVVGKRGTATVSPDELVASFERG